MLTRLIDKMLMWSPVLNLTGSYTLHLTLPLLFRKFFFIIPHLYFSQSFTQIVWYCARHTVLL